MKIALEGNMVFMSIEYLGIFSCGLSGGLAAVRKRYDIISILLVAWIAALGGGIVRDALLGAVPPAGITDRGSVLVTLLSGLVVAVAHPEIDRMTWPMTVTDAMALGSFAVVGTIKSLTFGTSGMTAIFLGMSTALAGGLLRDILLNVVPAVIRDQHWYALPSLIGCILTVFTTRATQKGMIGVSAETSIDVGIVALVVVLRLLSVRFDLKVPGAMHRRRAYLPLNDDQIKEGVERLIRGRKGMSVTITDPGVPEKQSPEAQPGAEGSGDQAGDGDLTGEGDQAVDRDPADL